MIVLFHKEREHTNFVSIPEQSLGSRSKEQIFWKNKVWYIHTMEHYSATKSNVQHGDQS